MDHLVDLDPPPEKSLAHVQAEQLNDAAMALYKDGRYGLSAAIVMIRRAMALLPDVASMWSNLGLLLWHADDLDGAKRALERALELTPESPKCQGNMGVFLSAVGDDQADQHLAEAIRLEPENLAPRWDRALLYLRKGDWVNGLKEYEVRIGHRGPSLYPEMPSPLWRGEDLDGKTLYVQAEQGIGDRILFSRYLAWVKQRWPTCRIYCCIYDGMVNLFWEFRNILTLLPQGIPWPDDIDYATYMCGLAWIHGSSPTNVPPDPGLLRDRVLIERKTTRCNLPAAKLPSLKVGICWTGNATQSRNHDRSVPLEMMMTLGEDPRIMLYSFQCSPGGDDLERLGAGDLICNLAPEIEREGWVSTGVALMEMDLLITVCTSLAHLAGALQIPCWTLLCADPYWIWPREGDSTPWYPGMRLIRQRKLREWQPVIDEVRFELSKLADQTLSL